MEPEVSAGEKRRKQRVIIPAATLHKSAFFFIQEAQQLEGGEPDEEEIRRAKMYRKLARDIADVVDTNDLVRLFEIRPLSASARDEGDEEDPE